MSETVTCDFSITSIVNHSQACSVDVSHDSTVYLLKQRREGFNVQLLHSYHCMKCGYFVVLKQQNIILTNDQNFLNYVHVGIFNLILTLG